MDRKHFSGLLILALLIGCSSNPVDPNAPIPPKPNPAVKSLSGPAADAAKAVEALGGEVAIEDGFVTEIELSVMEQGRKVTDADLVHLAELPTTKVLYLTNTQITNQGLAALKPLTSLEKLNLDGTQVSDDGLQHLHGLTSLKTVTLRTTNVSDAGTQALREALPDTLVTD